MREISAAVGALDLEPIRYKLVYDPEGEPWSRERAERAEIAYKRFLTLVVLYPKQRLVPLGDIDKFWHQHILDTRKYAEDCDKVFGHFLHHFPYFGLRGEEDAEGLKQAGVETAALFVREFGDEISSQGSCTDCKVCGPDPGACAPEPSCSGEPDPSVLPISAQGRPRFESAVVLG